MLQRSSAKCDIPFRSAKKRGPQPSHYQLLFTRDSDANRNPRIVFRNRWHIPCFAVSKRRSHRHIDHGQVRARIRATLAHRQVEYDRCRGGGATCGRIAVGFATGSARRVGRACFCGAQRLLNSEGKNRPEHCRRERAGANSNRSATPLRSINPPCPLTSSRRAFFCCHP